MPLRRNHNAHKKNKVSRMVDNALPHHRHHNIVNTTTSNVGHRATDIISHPLSKVGHMLHRSKNKTGRVVHA
jgi:hypothetical protein